MNLDEVCDRNQTRYGCRTTMPMAPFGMHSFGDTMICGRRGGQPFINATRPDPATRLCPAGTLPCSHYTSVDNTICYNAAEKREAVCPITGFEFSSGTSTLQNATSKKNGSVNFSFSRD